MKNALLLLLFIQNAHASFFIRPGIGIEGREQKSTEKKQSIGLDYFGLDIGARNGSFEYGIHQKYTFGKLSSHKVLLDKEVILGNFWQHNIALSPYIRKYFGDPEKKNKFFYQLGPQITASGFMSDGANSKEHSFTDNYKQLDLGYGLHSGIGIHQDFDEGWIDGISYQFNYYFTEYLKSYTEYSENQSDYSHRFNYVNSPTAHAISFNVSITLGNSFAKNLIRSSSSLYKSSKVWIDEKQTQKCICDNECSKCE